MYSNNHNRHFDDTIDHSFYSGSITHQRSQQSKQSMLRTMNTLFKASLNSMQNKLKIAEERYRGDKIELRCIQSFPHMKRSQNEYLSQQIDQQKIQDQSDDRGIRKDEYKRVFENQKQMFHKIDSLKHQIIKNHPNKSFNQVDLHQFPPSKREVNWDLLMTCPSKASNHQFFQTQKVNISEQKMNQFPITYTECSSTKRIEEQKDRNSKEMKKKPLESLYPANISNNAIKKVYKDIKEQILCSASKFGNTGHSKEDQKSIQLLAKLKRQKKQREQLLKLVSKTIK